MNAIEFQNRYTRVVKDFFSRCLEYEQIQLHKMQDITMCCTDKGFELRLETVEHLKLIIKRLPLFILKHINPQYYKNEKDYSKIGINKLSQTILSQTFQDMLFS